MNHKHPDPILVHILTDESQLGNGRHHVFGCQHGILLHLEKRARRPVHPKHRKQTHHFLPHLIQLLHGQPNCPHHSTEMVDLVAVHGVQDKCRVDQKVSNGRLCRCHVKRLCASRVRRRAAEAEEKEADCQGKVFQRVPAKRSHIVPQPGALVHKPLEIHPGCHL